MGTRIRCASVRWFLVGLMVFLAAGATAKDKDEDPPEVKALKKASVKGKYSKLLAVIHVPGDKDDYGEFKDYGAYDGTEWGNYKGLPKGHWVYVYPHWYIWEKKADK